MDAKAWNAIGMLRPVVAREKMAVPRVKRARKDSQDDGDKNGGPHVALEIWKEISAKNNQSIKSSAHIEKILSAYPRANPRHSTRPHTSKEKRIWFGQSSMVLHANRLK